MFVPIGAKALASNPGAKKVSAILDDDSDTFMRNECRDDKWVVVELSQVAKISRIELAQHELYSSRIKDFEVRGRQSHPRTDNVETSKGLNSTAWKLLGKFTAEKAKGTQDFVVERPLWVHYLLIRFISHYGNEPVCALNGIAVYGKSAAEELEDHLAEGETGLEIDGGELQDDRTSIPAAHAASDISHEARRNGNTTTNGQVISEGGVSGQQQKTGLLNQNPGVGKNNETDFSAAEGSQSSSQGTAVEDSIGTQGQTPASEVSVSGSDGSLSANGSRGAAGNADKDSKAQLSSTEKAAEMNTRGKNESSLLSSSSLSNGNASSAAINESLPLVAESGNATAIVHVNSIATAGGGGSSGESVGSLLDSLESLPIPRSKSVGGVYDVLIQEIRAIKAQQRVTAKALEAMQRNMTAMFGTLSRINTEYDISEAQLGARIDAIVLGHVARLEAESAELRHALGSAAKREHAALSLLAMLGAIFVLTIPHLGKGWKVGRGLVFVLAMANGVVGLALHWQSVDLIIRALKTLPITSSGYASAAAA